MTDNETTYLEVWVGMAEVAVDTATGRPQKPGRSYAWCAAHAEDQEDFEKRAHEALAADGFIVTALDQVSLAEDMNVIPDELFSLVGQLEHGEFTGPQIVVGKLQYVSAPQPRGLTNPGLGNY